MDANNIFLGLMWAVIIYGIYRVGYIHGRKDVLNRIRRSIRTGKIVIFQKEDIVILQKEDNNHGAFTA